MGVKIRVDKTHIDLSDKYEGNSCMVANAIRDALDLTEEYTVSVGYGPVYISHKGKQIKRTLEKRVADLIERWDGGGKVDPFEFDLNLPGDWRERLKAQ